MLSINIFSYIFYMMTVFGFLQSHILSCITINTIKSFVKFIYENNIIITL